MEKIEYFHQSDNFLSKSRLKLKTNSTLMLNSVTLKLNKNDASTPLPGCLIRFLEILPSLNLGENYKTSKLQRSSDS